MQAKIGGGGSSMVTTVAAIFVLDQRGCGEIGEVQG